MSKNTINYKEKKTGLEVQCQFLLVMCTYYYINVHFVHWQKKGIHVKLCIDICIL